MSSTFGQIRPLVSMVTDRVMMGKTVSPLFLGCFSDVVSVSCFGVRFSVIFHLMFVHYTFSSVWVAEWPPFGKKLPAR